MLEKNPASTVTETTSPQKSQNFAPGSVLHYNRNYFIINGSHNNVINITVGILTITIKLRIIGQSST